MRRASSAIQASSAPGRRLDQARPELSPHSTRISTGLCGHREVREKCTPHRRRPRPSTRRRHGGLRERSVQQEHVDLEVHEVREHEDRGQPRRLGAHHSRRAGAPPQPPPHAAADAPAAPRAARPVVVVASRRLDVVRGARRARPQARARGLGRVLGGLELPRRGLEPRGHAPQLPVALRQRLPRGPRGLRQVRGLRGPLLALVGQRLLRERARGLGRRRAPGRVVGARGGGAQSAHLRRARGRRVPGAPRRGPRPRPRARARACRLCGNQPVCRVHRQFFNAPEKSDFHTACRARRRRGPPAAAPSPRGPRRPWPRPCARGAAP